MFKPSLAAGRAGTGARWGADRGRAGFPRAPSPPVSLGIYFRGKKQAWLALSAGMTREPNKGAFEIVGVGGWVGGGPPLPLHAVA